MPLTSSLIALLLVISATAAPSAAASAAPGEPSSVSSGLTGDMSGPFTGAAAGFAAALVLVMAFSRRGLRNADRESHRLKDELQTTRVELEESVRRWRALVDAIPDLVFRIDRSGKILDYYPASRTTMDTPPEQVLLRNVDQIFPNDTARKILNAVNDAISSGQTTVVEYHTTGRSGPRWIESRFQAVAADEAICLARDITEQKHSSQQLRENEERLRTIVETIEGVFWTSEPGVVQATYVSPAVSKILGYPPERFLQNPSIVIDTIHPDDRPILLNAINEQAKGRRTSVEYRIFHADGSVRWIWDQGFPVFDSEGKLVAVNGLATNITERRLLEARLREAQKLEAIGTLAGGIAHDFNNILGSIIGFAELARIDAKGNDAVEQGLRDVLRASKRAKSLVEQILIFSRQQETERQAVQFDVVAQEAVQALRAIAPAGVQIELHVAAGLPPVLADSTQLHQIVMNLGTNAIHAIRPRTGSVRFEFDVIEISAESAQNHPELSPGRCVRLTATDSGAGIAPAAMNHLFEPFFTTKPPGEGSGLGLSVVHGIITSHRGGIRITSQPGAGTAVQVMLPAISNPHLPQAGLNSNSHSTTDSGASSPENATLLPV